MLGDRTTDLELADNLGLPAILIGDGSGDTLTWAEAARKLLGRFRRATVARRTKETEISVSVDLDDASTPAKVSTGIGYYDHMLEQVSRHGGFALELQCKGDLEVDEHHTIEDVALALGEALDRAADGRGPGPGGRGPGWPAV